MQLIKVIIIQDFSHRKNLCDICFHIMMSLCLQAVLDKRKFYFLRSNTWLPRQLSGKESTCQCRRRGFHPWVRKIPLEEEMANHAWKSRGQCSSCLKKSVDRGAWGAAVHGVTKSQTRLSMHKILSISFNILRKDYPKIVGFCCCYSIEVQMTGLTRRIYHVPSTG